MSNSAFLSASIKSSNLFCKLEVFAIISGFVESKAFVASVIALAKLLASFLTLALSLFFSNSAFESLISFCKLFFNSVNSLSCLLSITLFLCFVSLQALINGIDPVKTIAALVAAPILKEIF
ncbi:hypothetical protein [Mycoplasmopsis felifaucium]|uniref:Uncharacterized protein n=1 Tax=Mycoplasmopsis felifaucium TaxID=35768 RepID=A0ABZ2RQM8_9BACT